MAPRYSLLAVCILVCNVYLLQAQLVITDTDCGVSKGCVRNPCGCTPLTCKYFTSYRQDETNVYFEMTGIVLDGDSPYLSLGISTTSKMYSAYTIGCYWDGKELIVRDGVNAAEGHSHSFIAPINNGVTNLVTEFDRTNNLIKCSFTRARNPGNNQYAKDLTGNVTYFLLNAKAGSTSSAGFTQHTRDNRMHTSNAISLGSFLGECKGTASTSTLLFQLHGSLMLVAWVTLASVGVMLGMHFRVTISNTDLLGSRTWLKLHRVLQITAVLLTIASFIIVFVAVGELRIGQGINAAHSIIGIIVMSIALITILGAFSRRLISSDKAKLKQNMNTGHMLMGRLVLILALVNVFLGLLHTSLGLPEWPAYVVLGVIVFSIVVELALYLHSRSVTKHNSEVSEKADRPGSSEMSVAEPQYISMKGHPFRIGALVVYALVGAVTAIVVILAITEVIPA